MADTIKALVNALPSEADLTMEDKDKVELVRKSYDSMNDYQKQFVEKESYDKMVALEARLNELTFYSSMDELPDAAALTLDHKSKVEAARKAYDGMSSEKKKSVNTDLVDKLKALEERLKELTESTATP
jgi:flagellar basal-body rod modification protein FlgD